MRHFARLFPALLVFAFPLFPFAPQARADNFIITSGSFSATPGAGSVNTAFNFRGQGFAAGGGQYDGHVPAALCAPCQAGNAVSLNSLFNASDLGFGAVTINGANYARLYFGGGAFNFSAATIVLPSINSSLLTITTPFDFTGTLNGYNNSLVGNPGAAVFSATLSGQGMATLQFSTFMNGSQRLYEFRGITYNFQAPTPTPEPATLLLLGTGLAGIAAQRRRRQRIK